MRDNENLYRGRLGRFVEESIVPAIYPQRIPLTITAWVTPGEPVPFADAIAQEFTPFAIGTPWGRAWSTVWLHVTGEIPAQWRECGNLEVVMDLGFRKEMEGSQAEALAYRPDGTIIKAIEPYNRFIPIEDASSGRIDVYLEGAANPDIAINGLWAPTPYGKLDTVPEEPIYVIRQMDLAPRDETVWELNQDIEVLSGLVDELPTDSPRRNEIMVALNRAMDAVDPFKVNETAALGREALAAELAKPANASAHRVLATGHAHIDSAWLWPVRETIRKCARTFSNVLDLMDQDPEMVFSCSSAQQYAWIKASYPQIWERMKVRIAEGRFVPVGGMWVESDTNMPGSEAMARQFVMGKLFFQKEFGIDIDDVWLPDSFGYSGSLPQIAKAAGSKWFLTQKISWNETNTLPHHTFLWEGIDGSRIFTHFPPVDTYNSNLSARELAKAERQYLDQGHGTTSLVPFGYGDGGGGPTREMLAKAKRTANLEGSPKVTVGSPNDFFQDAEAELAKPYVWSGELYLETHRGTYTSQLKIKQANRRSEHLLRRAEIWATTACLRAGLPYPKEALDDAWQVILLNQFHDILPGSSIAWVYEDCMVQYARVGAVLEEIVAASMSALAGNGDLEMIANSAPVAQVGVRSFAIGTPAEQPAAPVSVTAEGDTLVLDNSLIRVAIDGDGLISSLLDKANDREAIPVGAKGGLLQIHNDRPTLYEAWDIDEHYSRTVTDLRDAESVTVVSETLQAITVRVVRRFEQSLIEQDITLRAGAREVDFAFDIDWHEQRRLMKLAFPMDCKTDRFASETQFGHIYRPTHANTSWDLARYETCAHRWVHVGEPGYGFAVANDSTYGHDVRSQDFEGKTGTTVRLSLIRGPKFPDPEADQGQHRMAVSVVVGATIADAIASGQRLNEPVQKVTGANPVAPLVEVDNPGIQIETIKMAEDGSGDVIVRLYEAWGQRLRGTLTADSRLGQVRQTDLLERELPPTAIVDADSHTLRVELRPFQIVTLRYHVVS